VSSDVTAHEPQFFLHVDTRFLWCQLCGNRTRIENRSGDRERAEAEHSCGLPCGCWSTEMHAATGEGSCAAD
jgi:hypothetical protein